MSEKNLQDILIRGQAEIENGGYTNSTVKEWQIPLQVSAESADGRKITYGIYPNHRFFIRDEVGADGVRKITPCPYDNDVKIGVKSRVLFQAEDLTKLAKENGYTQRFDVGSKSAVISGAELRVSFGGREVRGAVIGIYFLAYNAPTQSR
jgi:hypothetical protein